MDALCALHERAVTDFLSVQLWCAYIQVRALLSCRLPRCLHAGRPDGTEHDSQFLHTIDAPAEQLRDVCERAVVAGGLHYWQVRVLSSVATCARSAPVFCAKA